MYEQPTIVLIMLSFIGEVKFLPLHNPAQKIEIYRPMSINNKWDIPFLTYKWESSMFYSSTVETFFSTYEQIITNMSK